MSSLFESKPIKEFALSPHQYLFLYGFSTIFKAYPQSKKIF